MCVAYVGFKIIPFTSVYVFAIYEGWAGRTAKFILRLSSHSSSFSFSHSVSLSHTHTRKHTPLKRLYVSNPHNLVPTEAAVNSSHPPGELCNL